MAEYGSPNRDIQLKFDTFVGRRYWIQNKITLDFQGNF